LIPLLFFLTVTGVCAPFDATDCDYTVYIYDTTRAWGFAKYDDKILYFGGDFYNERDCWGMRIYEHEWLHMAYGNFHINGVPCMLRNNGSFT